MKSFFFSGEKLLPDYFLDEAEDFQQEWMQTVESQKKASSSEAAAGAAAGGESGGDTPAAVFAQVKTVLNSEVVDQIKATYLFVVDGDHPGK